MEMQKEVILQHPSSLLKKQTKQNNLGLLKLTL